MSHGVAENFIGILRKEESRSLRRLIKHGILLGALLLVTGLAVDLPEGSFLGLGMGIVAIGFLAGTGVGLVTGRWLKVRRFHASLTRSWNRWMRYSVACDTVEEVHRRVLGKPATRSIGWVATAWTAALFVTLLLLLFTVVDGAPAIDKTPVFAAYAVYVGALVGQTIMFRMWVHNFLVSLDELVRQGEVRVWGVI